MMVPMLPKASTLPISRARVSGRVYSWMIEALNGGPYSGADEVVEQPDPGRRVEARDTGRPGDHEPFDDQGPDIGRLQVTRHDGSGQEERNGDGHAMAHHHEARDLSGDVEFVREVEHHDEGMAGAQADIEDEQGDGEDFEIGVEVEGEQLPHGGQEAAGGRLLRPGPVLAEDEPEEHEADPAEQRGQPQIAGRAQAREGEAEHDDPGQRQPGDDRPGRTGRDTRTRGSSPANA